MKRFQSLPDGVGVYFRCDLRRSLKATWWFRSHVIEDAGADEPRGKGRFESDGATPEVMMITLCPFFGNAMVSLSFSCACWLFQQIALNVMLTARQEDNRTLCFAGGTSGVHLLWEVVTKEQKMGVFLPTKITG